MNIIERDLTELTQSYVINSNVSSWQNAKIIVFLIGHKKEYEVFVKQILESFKDLQNSVLLYELPADKKKWSSIESSCWENEQILIEMYRNASIIQDHFKKLEIIIDFSVPLSKKEELVSDIQNEANKWGSEFKYKDIFCEKLKITKSLSATKKELEEWIKEIFLKFKNKTAIDTFRVRQTSLIEKTQSYLDKERLFIICGSHHGNCETSHCPEEAKRFIDFLQTSGNFALFDCVS